MSDPKRGPDWLVKRLREMAGQKHHHPDDLATWQTAADEITRLSALVTMETKLRKAAEDLLRSTGKHLVATGEILAHAAQEDPDGS